MAFVLDTCTANELNDEYYFNLPNVSQTAELTLSAVSAEGGMLAYPKEALVDTDYVVDPGVGLVKLNMPSHDCYGPLDLLAALTAHNTKYTFVYQKSKNFDYSTIVCVEMQANGMPYTSPGHGPYAVLTTKTLCDVLAAPPVSTTNVAALSATNGITGVVSRPSGPVYYKRLTTAPYYQVFPYDGHWDSGVTVGSTSAVEAACIRSWAGYSLLTSVAATHTPLAKHPVLPRLAIVELRGTNISNHTFPPRSGNRYGRQTFSIGVVPAPAFHESGWFHQVTVNELDWKPLRINHSIRLALSRSDGQPVRFEGFIKFVFRVR